MFLQEELYTLFEAPKKRTASLIFNGFIYFLIVISIINLMLISVSDLNEEYGDIFLTIKNIVMPIFIIEYILRFYASGALEKYRGVKGKINYSLTPFALIDLIAILPFILTNIGINSSFIRSLRLLRVFRLFRVKKYVNFIKMLKNIMLNLKEELTVLLFVTSVLIIMLSFVVYDLEHDAQPEIFTNIFQTLWWAVATLTTIGYGDMFPITTMGKIITAIISVVGIAFVAIPGGMLASEFMLIITNEKASHNTITVCPKCGSKNLIISDAPKLTSNDIVTTFKTLKQCQSCEFVWLENIKTD